MHYQEQSKSSLLSPLTGYFLWAFLPKEPRGKMGRFCMLCKHVYLGSAQHPVLDAATSAPAPAPARPPYSHPTRPGDRTCMVVSIWVAVNRSHFYSVLPSPVQKQVNQFQRWYALTDRIPWTQSDGCPVWRRFVCREGDLGAAAIFAVLIKEERGHPCSCSLCIQLACLLMG